MLAYATQIYLSHSDRNFSARLVNVDAWMEVFLVQQSITDFSYFQPESTAERYTTRFLRLACELFYNRVLPWVLQSKVAYRTLIEFLCSLSYSQTVAHEGVAAYIVCLTNKQTNKQQQQQNPQQFSF